MNVTTRKQQAQTARARAVEQDMVQDGSGGADTADDGADNVTPLDSAKTDPLAQAVADSIEDPKERLARFVGNDGEAALMSGKPKQTNVPIKRPANQSAVCFHPDPAMRIQLWCYVAQPKEGGGFDKVFYLIDPELVPLVEESCALFMFVPYVTPQGSYGLMEINMTASQDGSLNSWHESRLSIVNEWAGKWVRMKSDHASSGYLVIPMKVPASPKWPELNAWQMVETAFGKRQITSRDHPILIEQLGIEG